MSSTPTPEPQNNTLALWTQYANAYTEMFGKLVAVDNPVFYPMQILSLLSDAQEAGTRDGTLPDDSRVNAMINGAKLMLSRMIENAVEKNPDIKSPW